MHDNIQRGTLISATNGQIRERMPDGTIRTITAKQSIAMSLRNLKPKRR